MKRTVAVALTALTGCVAHAHEPSERIVHAPATTVDLTPRPTDLEVSRSAPLPSPSQSPGEGTPHTVIIKAQGAPAVVRDLGRFEATCYDLRGRTASGAEATLGSIAVDPAVIRLGTHLNVDGWGTGTADDTGGAIKGRRIDVWLPTLAACMAWGVRWVDVEEAAA